MGEKKYFIGVDVGATRIRAALFYQKKMISVLDEPTEHAGGATVVDQIIGVIAPFLKKNKVQGIGVGIPGPFNPKKGLWIRSPNISGVKNIPLQEILKKKFHTKVVLENDTACAALAEAANRGLKELVYINLGTGIGVGVIIDGKILGKKDRNMEAGHLDVGGEEMCNVGHLGCWEAYSSGTAILNFAKQFYSVPRFYVLLQDAKAGKVDAKMVFERAGKYLGMGAASLVNIFSPSLIVLGGSVVEAYPYMKKEMMKELRQRVFKMPRISLKKLKYPGLVGARMLVE